MSFVLTEEMKTNLLNCYNVDPHEEHGFSIQHGMERTLDILGIVVEGINDYDDELMTTKIKCDCCGSSYMAIELSSATIPAKEFDGLACEDCLEELQS